MNLVKYRLQYQHLEFMKKVKKQYRMIFKILNKEQLYTFINVLFLKLSLIY